MMLWVTEKSMGVVLHDSARLAPSDSPGSGFTIASCSA